jgi:hypothetical protein
MTRTKKLRSVYNELKSVLDKQLNTQELLDCALLIIQADEESPYDPAMTNYLGRIPFSEIPVNDVMEKYSWKIMNREVLWSEDEKSYCDGQDLVNTYVLHTT